MTMTRNAIALIFAGLSILPVTAQESTETQAPAAEAVETDLQIGKIYKKAEHSDWTIDCVRTATPANDPCEMNQILSDGAGNNVVKVSVTSLPDDASNPVQAAMQIIAPLETYLPAGIAFSIDDSEAQTLGFYTCNINGCITRLGLTADDIDTLKKGAEGKVVLRPAAAPDQLVTATLSLSGFTAAHDELTGQ